MQRISAKAFVDFLLVLNMYLDIRFKIVIEQAEIVSSVTDVGVYIFSPKNVYNLEWKLHPPNTIWSERFNFRL